jgi:hypothetical protein
MRLTLKDPTGSALRLIAKVADHRDGYRINQTQYGTVIVEMTGRRGRTRGKWNDYTLVMDIEQLRRLLAEAEAANPEKMIAEAALAAQAGIVPDVWGPFTKIDWQDGRAVTTGYSGEAVQS